MDTFSIAFVCTGNRFRSVLAEAFVRRLTLGLPVRTDSFGTLQLHSAVPLPQAVEIARECGIDLTSHRTRYVGGASLERLDLVLGFEESHVRQAVVDAGAPRDRTFTMRHFAQLLQESGPPETDDVVARARGLVEQASELRTAKPLPGLSIEMPDPLGAAPKVYRATATEIRELSLLIVAILFGASNTDDLPPLPPSSGVRRALKRG